MTETLKHNGFQEVQPLRYEYSLMMARYWNDMYVGPVEDLRCLTTRQVHEHMGRIRKDRTQDANSVRQTWR